MLGNQLKLSQVLHGYFRLGFHISREAWNRFDLAMLVDPQSSRLAASEVYLLRLLADRVNEKRSQTAQRAELIYGGQLAAVGVIVDVLRYITVVYSQVEQPGTIRRGLEWTGRQQGSETVTQPPPVFARFFPPSQVLEGSREEAEFHRASGTVPEMAETIVREMVLLFVSGANPAFRPFRLLFDDTELKRESLFVPMMGELERYFANQPPFGPTGLPLFECLFSPIRACPDSLEGQIDYIRRNWGSFLPLELLERLLLALDILKEERTLRGLGPGPSEALRFDRDTLGLDYGYSEPAAFSIDADWMSNVVLIAKTVYVWLYQLSKTYQRDIRQLRDVPDEELDRLARWGFTGLWLIGVWERSSASQKIKQIMGNPEAASSAYSLYDYVIARDLGGEEAFEELKRRAWQRGIRLASDMVPNHMGIYSKWTIEHPQWFLQSDHPPFPVYQYTGVDLSEDPRVCIQIEDGYWQHRDAAVVLKRIDKWTGDTRYIYHGNDGTSMPWNDTAQLNFLLPEVREAVIQTILHVARRFPIIRFDAAMTLAKRHYQRLWFPRPGEGGAIPSRAEYGMSKGQFDSLIPKEFWREVVDRVAQEQPDTLLLAEAFWLMEGYFVRTLGMHRVYNSAFMNMLKMEDNAKYRSTIKNVLEFSPEVLKRFVNFMNNPDERTAVDQFGRGDKYYGVAAMLVTMPGLPMFGHGQIEGFTEKYGMEYRRSYWDEQVDQEMVRRHEAQIFPLMRRRYLFSGAANFALYDFTTPEGWVDENVFAYSNRVGDQRAVILYNNAYNTTLGVIHTSTAINVGDADKPALVRRSLAEALSLNAGGDCLYAFRDYESGLEYLRVGRELSEKGLFAELHAYQYHAFLDFREIRDTDGSWHELTRRLNGGGVVNLTEAHQELVAEPVLIPFRALLNPDRLRELKAGYEEVRGGSDSAIRTFCEAVRHITGADTAVEPSVRRFMAGLDELMQQRVSPGKKKRTSKKAPAKQKAAPVPEFDLEPVAFTWLTLEALGAIRHSQDTTPASSVILTRVDTWAMHKPIRETFESLLPDKDAAYWDSKLVTIIVTHAHMLEPSEESTLAEALRRALTDPAVREYLEVHSYDNILWLNKERLERMTSALALVASLATDKTRSARSKRLTTIKSNAERIVAAAEQAGYQVDKMLQLLT